MYKIQPVINAKDMNEQKFDTNYDDVIDTNSSNCL